MHTGIDLLAKKGTAVFATSDGFVEFAKFDSEHGYYIQIEHSDKYQTKYSHLKDLIVINNMFVTKGQIIGYVGKSGKATDYHLHYEVYVDGKTVDPKDFLKLDGY